MTKGFEIKILRTEQTCPDPIRDTCLAGALRVTINGTVVVDDDDFGVAPSALALLRTIDREHHASSPVIFGSYLLSHDCGFPFFGCGNYGANWAVSHRDGVVHISDVENYTSHPIVRHLRFPSAETDLPLATYRDEVIRFALAARVAYFADGDRQIADADERSDYEAFWREYDDLVPPHAQP